MTVIVKEGLANGRLTTRGDVADFAVAARTRGLAADALALAAVLAQPWSDVVLSGAATPGQLRENLAAYDVAFDDDLDAALAGLAEEPGEYWRRRSALSWT
jgi:aryl-alcohol dehydrogenase-like predicted oxidoreductase